MSTGHGSTQHAWTSESSAELSEAVNSMWKWYKGAAFCLAYLGDVPHRRLKRRINFPKRFKESEWFNRGWTLQELLAPYRVFFANIEWQMFGRKHDEEILELISARTGIERGYLLHSKDLRSASVAQKLSWASTRQTTREEDVAYCLLGLLNVNMPLLYGEGNIKAFRRLQAEIIRGSPDESIFAWTAHDIYGLESRGGLQVCLAPDLRAFSHAGHIAMIRPNDKDYILRPPFYVTNQGLSFDAQVRKLKPAVQNAKSVPFCGIKRWMKGESEDTEAYLVPLNCKDLSQPEQQRCVIALQRWHGMTFRTIGIRVGSGFKASEVLWKEGKTLNKHFLLTMHK